MDFPDPMQFNLVEWIKQQFARGLASSLRIETTNKRYSQQNNNNVPDPRIPTEPRVHRIYRMFARRFREYNRFRRRHHILQRASRVKREQSSSPDRRTFPLPDDDHPEWRQECSQIKRESSSPSSSIGDHSESPPPHDDQYERISDIPPRLPASQRADCICPINTICPQRGKDEHDCRTLVVEHDRWKKNMENSDELSGRIWLGLGNSEAVLGRLQMITDMLERVENAPRLSRALQASVTGIKKWIVYVKENEATQQMVDQSNPKIMVSLENFITKSGDMIDKGVPQVIIDQLRIIHGKWQVGNFSNDPTFRPTRTNRPTIRKSARVFGHNGLVNGQTWPKRAAMIPDGAHSLTVGGIDGRPEVGAWAVVMSYHNDTNREYYADVDLGETVYYIGTALKRQADDDHPTNVHRPLDPNDREVRQPTAATRSLIKSKETGLPVRMFRSSKFAKINKLRPQNGYRYDGLYRVVDYELLDKVRQIYKFKIERLEEQSPLLPEARCGPQERGREWDE